MMRSKQEIQYDFSYESLFQFISQNKSLPEKVNNLDSNSTKLIQLKQAIEKPDITDPIFSDEDCDIYLLKLFKDHKITSSTFFCVYNYLMACMQYGDQPVRQVDQKLCKVTLKQKPTMIPLFIEESLNEEFEGLVSSVAILISQESGKEVSNTDLINYFKNLPAIEQYLICIRFDVSDMKENEALQKVELASDSYFVRSGYGKGTKYYFNITITEYIKNLISEIPVKLLPGFGLIGSHMIAKLHSCNFHFYPLYNKHVVRNLTIVHNGQFEGAFAVAQHDNYHSFVANLFHPTDREFICNTLPKLLTKDNFLSEDDLKPLLYGDSAFSDLDPFVLDKKQIR